MESAPDIAAAPAESHAIGTWLPGSESTADCFLTVGAALRDLATAFYALEADGGMQFAVGGRAVLGDATEGYPLLAIAPACRVSDLGDPDFRTAHGLRYNYYAGAMANGIGSEAVVEAMGNAGMLGFFGAAGLSPVRIEQALKRLTKSMAGKPFGFNLINSPNEPAWQEEVVDLYLRYGVRLVEASAYVALSQPLVRYRVTGLYRDEDGRVVAPNKVIAKLSRAEVATRFFSPPPEKMLRKLVEAGQISEAEAALAAEIPMAEDITVEADSGGHTDHRPALTVLPAMLALRDALQEEHGFSMPLRVGLGGGVSTPASAAAAFAMGAGYIQTGSVNQSCREAGTSDLVREMLAKAFQTDIGTAPAADMFEMGVTVQVLKKGTRFIQRGNKLYELYRTYDSLEAIPEKEREKLESDIFRAPLDKIWEETKAFFEDRDPKQIEKAEKNPKHKMALVFRWYLGHTSLWANAGVAERQEDYQVWCGPAMGAFNEWAKGSYLEDAGERSVVSVALNILYGAAVQLRANGLRQQGIAIAHGAWRTAPRRPEELQEHMV